jgi:hypothetical protein
VNGQTPITLNNVEMPIIDSRYIREPIQPGDQGMTVAADYALGGVTGLGSGVATTARPPNLSALAFAPLGNANFPTMLGNFTISGDQLTLNGPGGAVMLDASGANSVNVTTSTVAITAKTQITATVGGSSITVNSSQITLTAGGKTLTINSSGITLDGILWETHDHLYTPGNGTPTDTGPPLQG